jgi:hypothetical protein
MNISLIFAPDLKVSDWDFPLIHIIDTIVPRLLGEPDGVCLHYPVGVRNKVITHCSDKYKNLTFCTWGPEVKPGTEWFGWSKCKESHVNFWLHETGDLIVYLCTEQSSGLNFDLSAGKKYVKYNPLSYVLKAYSA